ncbi:hypothetical protein [Nocardia tengchongensis]|uniref:hypothetical protein n=1 Tax=Nocardia tengchongensis TaxID=2055889 RepID=UPI003667E5B9
MLIQLLATFVAAWFIVTAGVFAVAARRRHREDTLSLAVLAQTGLAALARPIRLAKRAVDRQIADRTEEKVWELIRVLPSEPYVRSASHATDLVLSKIAEKAGLPAPTPLVCHLVRDKLTEYAAQAAQIANRFDDRA